MKLDVWGAAIQGRRSRQEDCFLYLVEDDRSLLVLCDGMGGHEGGDCASRVVGEAFVTAFSEASSGDGGDVAAALDGALHAAHRALRQAVDDATGPPDMGTTLVAAFASGSDIHWLSVGDSHLYHFRGGALSKLNADHSMAATLDKLADIGRLTPEEALSDPHRHALRSSISTEDIALVDSGSKPGFLKRGDRILLASDGIDTLPLSLQAEIIHRHRRKPPSLAVEKLLEAVETADNPNQDNTTLLMAALRGNGWL